jgi:hypothetical protein
VNPRCGLAVVVVVLMLAFAAQASTPLASFDTVLGIQRNGSVVVVEHFTPLTPTVQFQWSTDTEFPSHYGIHMPRIVNILQVTSADGRPLSYDVHRYAARVQLDIQTAGAHELRIVYSVRNAMQFLHDRDELLWSAGEGWRGASEKTTFFVQVPPEATSLFRAQAHLRGVGLLPMQQSDSGPDRIWFQSPRPLREGDALMVNVVFPAGVITSPPALEQAWWFVRANTILLLPLIILTIMLALRLIKGLPQQGRVTIVPQYEPPEDLSAAEVGLLLDDQLDPRDVTATVIDLAIRGYIQLEQTSPDEGVDFQGQDFILRLRRPIAEWHGLAPYEYSMLFHSFYGGSWTKLSSLALRFYSAVPVMRSQVVNSLRSKGMYWVDPKDAQKFRILNFGVLLVVLYIVQWLGIFSFGDSWLLTAIAISISALIVQLVGQKITAKTLKGLRTLEKIRGFQQFLDSVEGDRLERLPTDLFEKWLPYAMALGVEHHWANSFADVAIGPPLWFDGCTAEVFNTTRLARLLERFTHQSVRNFTILPRLPRPSLNEPDSHMAGEEVQKGKP